MGYEYLWQNIRVKGGAYGCMSSFNRIGEGFFVSYRDPNLERTMEIYEGVAAFPGIAIGQIRYYVSTKESGYPL